MPEAPGRALGELLAGVDVVARRGDLGVPVRAVHHDSRRVESGDLFCAVDGTRARGLAFASEAVRRGAAAVLAGTEVPDLPVPAVQVADVRAAMGIVSSAAAGHPTARVPTVGITGTNGKTTTCALVEAALAALGLRAGVMGTIDARLGDRRWPASLTTPEAPDLHRLAAEMVEAGADALVLEVSSHGIALARSHGTSFRVVAFANLSQDHLDFHGTMEAYGAAKLRLFTDELAYSEHPKAVVNVDDPFGRRIAAEALCPVVTVSAEGRPGADVAVIEARLSIAGLEARVAVGGEHVRVASPLIGGHNLANVALALGIVHALEVGSLEVAADGIGGLTAVPGRLEQVPDPRGVTVLVDYAHSPDALVRVVDALRELTDRRLLVLFGCGGDRDRSKRPLMGAAAARGDLVVVTSDNPRTEPPAAILEMALQGVVASGLPEVGLAGLARAERGYAVEADRRTAIRAAVRAARPGDVVLIAGKGHEPYQILGEQKVPRLSRRVLKECTVSPLGVVWLAALAAAASLRSAGATGSRSLSSSGSWSRYVSVAQARSRCHRT